MSPGSPSASFGVPNRARAVVPEHRAKRFPVRTLGLGHVRHMQRSNLAKSAQGPGSSGSRPRPPRVVHRRQRRCYRGSGTRARARRASDARRRPSRTTAGRTAGTASRWHANVTQTSATLREKTRRPTHSPVQQADALYARCHESGAARYKSTRHLAAAHRQRATGGERLPRQHSACRPRTRAIIGLTEPRSSCSAYSRLIHLTVSRQSAASRVPRDGRTHSSVASLLGASDYRRWLSSSQVLPCGSIVPTDPQGSTCELPHRR